jgi:uncharacterized protein YjlB
MKTESYFSAPHQRIPNNRLPLLVHRNAMPGGGVDAIIARFRENGWSNNWRNPGIYTYPHFHSTTHECLGCAQGWIDFRLSVGDSGFSKVRVQAGDVIVMPAGVSHEDVGHSDDIEVCGGYPDGRVWDNMRPEFLSDDTYAEACKRIMALPIPDRDPVTGGPIQLWHHALASTDASKDLRDGLDAPD